MIDPIEKVPDPSLKSETNTQAIEQEIMAAAITKLQPLHHHLNVDFEHGQWWVTCLDCGAQWATVDCQAGENGPEYFDFEEASEGDEYCISEANRIARARQRVTP
jgi:hypothetical protein